MMIFKKRIYRKKTNKKYEFLNKLFAFRWEEKLEQKS